MERPFLIPLLLQALLLSIRPLTAEPADDFVAESQLPIPSSPSDSLVSYERCEFESAKVLEKFWPVFRHDPKKGEMEIPLIDILVNREGKAISYIPLNKKRVPEAEWTTLRKIIPAMAYKAANSCDEPIESYVDCPFYEYFLLREPGPEVSGVEVPYPRWRISPAIAANLRLAGLTYPDRQGVVDFYLDKEGNVTKTKGINAYGKSLSKGLFKIREAIPFLPAKVDGQPVESVIRLHLGKDKDAEITREFHLKRERQLHPWPLETPPTDLFIVEANLALNEGAILDVQFLTQMPSEVAIQLLRDLKTWYIDPASFPKEEKANALHVKIGFEAETGTPVILEEKFSQTRPPIPVAQQQPEYPSELRRAGYQGVAVVHFIVTEKGRTRNPEVHTASDSRFGRAAVDAVKRWKFEPAMQDGVPFETRVQVVIPFIFHK